MSNRWTSPITDPKMERKIANDLYQISPKYGCLYNLAIDTGVPVEKLLTVKVGDVKESAIVLSYQSKPEVPISKDLHEQLTSLSAGKKKGDFLFTAKDNKTALAASTFKKVLQKVGTVNGQKNVGTNSLRKTYYYHIYKENGIEYTAKLLGHATTILTKQYLGLNGGPTPTDRVSLLTDHHADHEIDYINEKLNALKERIYDPINPDSFYSTLSNDLEAIKTILLKYQS